MPIDMPDQDLPPRGPLVAPDRIDLVPTPGPDQVSLVGSAVYASLLQTRGIDAIDFGENLVEGGEVLNVTDEAFAEAKNLLDPNDPQFAFGDFDPKRGQRFSSWETRRHSKDGQEEVEIKLGKPGKINCVVVDTKWHDGNHAQFAELLVSNDGKNWEQLVAPVELEGHSAHLLTVADDQEWSHVKLVMYPDGGIARLRLYSEVPQELDRHLGLDDCIVIRHLEEVPKPAEKEAFSYPSDGEIEHNKAHTDWDKPVVLTSSRLGAKIVGTSNQRYSHAGNVLKDIEYCI